MCAHNSVSLAFLLWSFAPTSQDELERKPTGNSSQPGTNNGSLGNEWYIYVIALFAGVAIGFTITFIIMKLRHVLAKRRNKATSVPVSRTTGSPSMYQEPNLQRSVVDERERALNSPGRLAEYHELSSIRGISEHDYQGLRTNVKPASSGYYDANVDKNTSEGESRVALQSPANPSAYQALDREKMHKEENYEPSRKHVVDDENAECDVQYIEVIEPMAVINN